MSDNWAMARGRKTGRRDFKPGENNRRGPARIPRGSIKALYARLLERDADMLYGALLEAAKDRRLARHLARDIGPIGWRASQCRRWR